MAHTILHSDGFECGDVVDYRYSLAERGSGVTPSTTTTNPALGYGRAMVISSSDSGFVSPYLPSNSYTRIFTAFHHRTTTNNTNESALVTLYDEYNDAAQITITIQYDGSSGQILRARRGTKTGTLLATSTANLPMAGNWAHVSIMAFIDGTSGKVKVNIDSSTVIDFTGNTQNTANARIDRLRIHGRVSGESNVYDNWVIATGSDSDPMLPVVRIYTQVPNYDDAVQFAVSGAASNWAAVSDVPPNDDTNYTYSSTTGQQDTFGHAAPSIVSTVLGVGVYMNARRDDAGIRKVKPVVRPGTSSYTPTSESGLYSRYRIVGYIWQNNPSTGWTWTPAEAAGAKFGYRLTG